MIMMLALGRFDIHDHQIHKLHVITQYKNALFLTTISLKVYKEAISMYCVLSIFFDCVCICSATLPPRDCFIFKELVKIRRVRTNKHTDSTK